MKLNELKKIIRTTIKSEVRKAIREELTEIMVGKAVKEQGTSLKSMVKARTPKPKTQTPQKRFTSNPQLNEILNQTVGFNGGNSDAAEPDIDETISMTSGDVSNGALRGRFAQLMGLENDVQGGGGTLDNNLAQTAAAMGRSSEDVSPDVAKALTRDYSDVMKAIDKKKQSGGPLKG